jgi:hypothetical protein
VSEHALATHGQNPDEQWYPYLGHLWLSFIACYLKQAFFSWCGMVNGRSELRGALTHTLTGKTGHFRDWTTLVRLIEPFVAAAALVPIPSDPEETSHDDLCF